MTQVITSALDLGYISNRHCQWYGAPALAERLFRPTESKPRSTYRSFHGTTEGPHEPAECGDWWYRFFQLRPTYVTLQDVDPARMLQFRQSVASLTNVFDRPILFKNLYASLRIQAIAHYLPESLFIVTNRDEIDNGHSLLEARYRVFKDYDCWWSMEPPKVEDLKNLPAHQQVIEQIRHIQATIAQDLRSSGVSLASQFDLGYEEFCMNPGAKIDALQAFLRSNECLVSRAATSHSGFERRDKIRIDRSLYSAMVAYAKER